MRLSTALACSLFAARPKRGQAQVGMGNPAAINCVDQNFTNIILYAPNGDQYGVCIFSNTTACDDWAFERGSCDTANPNFSVYCADNGGEVSQEDVDWGEVEGAPPATYGVCTSNGEQCTEYDYYGNNNCSFVDPMIVGQPINGCMGSPDGCYCSDNGYTMSPTLYEPTGGEYALCIFSNETACDSWAYFRGECNTSNPNFQVYCTDNGGELSKKSVDWGDVEGALPAEYEVCTTDGVECAENDYYTSQCNQVETTTSESTAPADGTPAIIGMPNPASTGCVEKGGIDESLYEADGGEYGVCLFNDGTACDSWGLERGECAEGTTPVFSTFCADSGGEISEEDVDWGASEGNPPATYEVCTVNGFQCAANDYYTTGCADFTVPSPTPGTDSTGAATETIGEAMSATKVPIGESAQIECQSGSHCCIEGNFDTLSGGGVMTFGGDSVCADGVKVSSGLATDCSSDDCVITCTGACDVKVVGVVDTPVVTAPVPSPDSAGTATETVGEAMSATKVPKGESAQIECQSGSHCCIEGNFDTLSGGGVMTFGGDSVCADGVKVSSGLATDCSSDDCVITCTGACDVTEVVGVVETPAGNPPVPAPEVLGSTPQSLEPSGSNVLSHVFSLVVVSLQIFGALV
mmetsp:Transcript_29514/g.45657  ORF Transcript_29514/g.45657 Transcript_29514/m.45657 type:complete len:636 (-) Transcript_29514:621-2528(-)